MPKVEQEVTVNAPVDVVYGAWHNFENFPRFMDNIEEVRVVGGGRSHWKAKGPLGTDAEWDAEITLDEPQRAIGWRSIEGNSAVKTAGRVNFDGDAGRTKLRVVLQYDPPAGVLGDVVAKIFADPERQVAADLERFREAIERGAELSGFTYGHGEGDAGDTLGGSMGAVTEEDLEAIDAANAGLAPEATDDPAHRNPRGEDFGHSDKDLPNVGKA
jgi:uncharacterized protein YndB with AHSA1/START domain